MESLARSDGHRCAAVVAWVLRRSATASRLRRRPVRVREQRVGRASGAFGEPGPQQGLDGAVSGTARCLRPLPSQRTAAPAPRVMSPQFRPVSSETRRPVWTASEHAWPCPVVLPSGSGRVRRAGRRPRRGQEGHDPLVEPLRRDGQDALDEQGVLGVAQRGVGEQRADRGQPDVAGPGAVVRSSSRWFRNAEIIVGVQVVPVQLRRAACRSGCGRSRAAAAGCRGRRRWCGGWPGAAGRAGR